MPEIQAPTLSIYRLQISHVSRGAGRTSVGTAAYISRERLRDERTGRVYDHRQRGGLDHAVIIVPNGLEEADIAWTKSRESLWNAAEKAERRVNARVARQYQIALPHELAAPQRLLLAKRFAQNISDRYGVIADLAVHSAPPGGDPRNYHAHVLTTTRVLTGRGLGAKSPAEWNNGKLQAAGRPVAGAEFRVLRKQWEELANEALRQAGLQVRIDHRSLAEQGIDREPQRPKPRAVVESERRAVAKSQREFQTDRAAPASVVPAGPLPSAQVLAENNRGLELADAQSEARRKWLDYVRQKNIFSQSESSQSSDVVAAPRRDQSSDLSR